MRCYVFRMTCETWYLISLRAWDFDLRHTFAFVAILFTVLSVELVHDDGSVSGCAFTCKFDLTWTMCAWCLVLIFYYGRTDVTFFRIPMWFATVTFFSRCWVLEWFMPQHWSQVLNHLIQHREIVCDNKITDTDSLQERDGAQKKKLQTYPATLQAWRHESVHQQRCLHEEQLVQQQRDAQNISVLIRQHSQLRFLRCWTPSSAWWKLHFCREGWVLQNPAAGVCNSSCGGDWCATINLYSGSWTRNPRTRRHTRYCGQLYLSRYVDCHHVSSRYVVQVPSPRIA